MQYTLHTLDDVLLAEILKPCVGESWTPCMHEEIKSLLREGIRKFVIDLRDCRFVSSNGVGALIAILISVGQAGGRLCLCGVNERVTKVLQVSGVYGLLEIHVSREDAFAAVRGLTGAPSSPGPAPPAGLAPPA